MSNCKCDRCNKICINYGMVQMGNDEDDMSETICNDCYNQEMAEVYGIENYKNFIPEIIFKDFNGVDRKFHIKKTIFGTGILWEAIEFLDDDGNTGYLFELYQELIEDSFGALQQLYDKVRNGISKKYIKKEQSNGEAHNSFNENYIEGKIEWDDRYNGRIPKFKIDGQEYSLEELGEMMMALEGWNFKLEIKDASDKL